MPRTSLIPTPQQLQSYKEVDERLPAKIIELAADEAKRGFRYALAGLGTAALLAVLVFGGFAYLVMQNHETAAKWLLGVGVLNFIRGFFQSRLGSDTVARRTQR